MSNHVQPHRWQPTRIPRPWGSPSKNTGVGCHFRLQYMKVKRQSEVDQLSPMLSDLMDCSLPGSSIHGILQTRVLEWGAIAFSKEMATHSNFLAWRIPWTEEPGRPQSMGLQESDTTEQLSTHTRSFIKTQF